MPWPSVCSDDMPYLGIYFATIVKGQALRQHRDYRNHGSYYSYTINSGKSEGGEVKNGSPAQSRWSGLTSQRTLLNIVSVK